MKIRPIITFLGLTCICLLCYAQQKTISLWPSLAPGTEALVNKESWKDSTNVYDVYQPNLTLYLKERGDSAFPAIIVCPGGGYRQIVIEKEGYKIARWLNQNNISAFVLKYRLNVTEALRDAQRAVSLVRNEAKAFNIDADKIGIIGFSAGAHLAANLIIHYDENEKHDAIDTTSNRPDFMIGIYGVYGGKTTTGVERQKTFFELIDKNTPPVFLVHAGNDPKAPVQSSIDFYSAFLKSDIPAELHIYEQGKHGFALETNRGVGVTSTVNSWSRRCIEWLKLRGIL